MAKSAARQRKANTGRKQGSANQKPNAERLQAEREASRLEALKTASRGQPNDWLDRFAPGSFGCHELLDRMNMVAGILDEYVLNHPACLANPQWYAEADAAISILCSLYQQVGRDH